MHHSCNYTISVEQISSHFTSAMAASFLQIPNNFSALNLPPPSHDSVRKHGFCGLSFKPLEKMKKPLNFCTFLSKRSIGWEKDAFLGVRGDKGRRKVVVVSGFGFNGGGGGKDEGANSRAVGNLILAIGLTYLTLTGQLGWILDTIVSVWLLLIVLPILGLGAFIWWAGRDIVQSECPNCGNSFQVFKSTLNDEAQVCPYCTQPFTVVGDKFVSDPRFSNQPATFEEAFSDFFTGSKKVKDSSKVIVDVEAEVTDVD